MSFALNSSLKTKAHYEILDGLRGVAALAVVIFHFMEIIISDFSINIIAHGFLAVDFFFCLSGFVIAYAYDDKLPKIGLKQFYKQRLIRLQPLVILGGVLGLLAFLFTPIGNSVGAYSTWQISLLFLATVFVIPYPSMEDRYFNLFGLNAPAWSLFWEYIANIVYSLVLVKLHKKMLAFFALIAAVCIVYIAKVHGNTLGGWDGSTFWHGGARIMYSFLAGMCIFRFQLIIKNKLGFLPLTLLLVLAFMAPYNETWNWITEPFLILIYFPLIISLGAGSVLKSSQQKICNFSGQISYPLYVTHYFAMWSFGSYYNTNKPSTETLLWVVPLIIIVQLLVAYIAMKFYDLPLRKRLMKK
jgi:peptidoglycan/LPS O-acetylase OafA/YrhL